MRDRVWSTRPRTSRFSPQAARGRAPASPTSRASVTCAGSWPPWTTAPPAVRRLSPGSLKRTFSAWRRLARWLAQHQVTCLDQVDRSLLEKYPQFLAERGLTRGPVTTEMFAITRLWAYAPFLLPADRITMPPWDEPGAEPGDFPGAPAGGAGENTTIPVHPAVMSPLLVAALRTVT